MKPRSWYALGAGGLLAIGLAGLFIAWGRDTRAADPAPGVTREPGPAAQRVRVGEVRRGSLGGLSGIAGITSPFRRATVAAEVGARIVERHVEPGQHVAAGDALVTVDAETLSIAVDEARATLDAREVDLAEAQRALDRGDELRRNGAISEGQHDELGFAKKRAESTRTLADAALRRAQRARADAVVRAPFAGTVERIEVQVGDYLSPAAPVATLADFARVRLRAGVTASEAARLTPGAPAEVSIPALGGYETTASVHSIGQMADETTGTYPVELWLDNEDRAIRGGMVGQVRMAAAAGEEGALVPRNAVLRRQGRLAVYVVEARDGALRVYAQDVRVGQQQGDYVELLEGPEPGARVVVDGLFALTDGAVVFIDESSTP